MTIKEFFSSRIAAFGHAFRGWGYALKTQQNAWIHSLVAIAVIAMGLWLKLPARDWAVLVLTIAMVFIAEFINTSIEAVVDLASPGHHPLAKVGKDVGAAAVLVAALAAILIGLLILGPPLVQKLGIPLGQSPQMPRAEETAFKGMELYSWQNEAGDWQYAILVGTNRNKTLEEVQSTPLDLQGVKNAIAQLAIGESLFWINNVYDAISSQTVNLPFPPDTVVNEIKDFAREKQVDLYIP
jgi:diacylglycerol kinase (ATP)